MSFSLYLVNAVTALLPPTRCYAMKARMYSLCGLSVAQSARIVSSASFFSQSDIVIGEDTFVGHEVRILASTERVIIGSRVDIAPQVLIHTGSHEIGNTSSRRAGTGFSREITIGDGTWIGARATVLAGVTIGKGVVIGAGSLVTSDIPDNVLAFGSPCKVVRSLNA